MGCGASASKKAPFLAAYFKELEVLMKEVEGIDPVALLMDPSVMKSLEEKKQAAKPKLQDYLSKSFDGSDANKDGVLSTDEARQFFDAYAELFCQFHEKHDVSLVKAQMTQMKQMTLAMAEMFGPNPEMKREITRQLKDAEKQATNQIKQRAKERRDGFATKKDEYKAAAFAFIDVDKDGKVQRKELLDAFEYDSEKNIKVNEALGLLSPNEAALCVKEKQMAEQIMNAPPDAQTVDVQCAQQ